MPLSLVRRLLVLALGAAAGAATFFSGHVAVWWGQLESPDHFAQGSVPFRLLAWRASLHEADVHFAIWLIAGVGLLWHVTSRRGATLTCLGLVLIGLGIELMQPAMSTRNGEWGDALGATLGVFAALIARVVRHRRRSSVASTAGSSAAVACRSGAAVGA